MREYVIMTDSCCDLTDHMAKELELTVVPLTVHIDGTITPICWTAAPSASRISTARSAAACWPPPLPPT